MRKDFVFRMLSDGCHFLPVLKAPQVKPVVGCRNPSDLPTGPRWVESSHPSRIRPAHFARAKTHQSWSKLHHQCISSSACCNPPTRRFSATLSDFERTSRLDFYELHCRGCSNSFKRHQRGITRCLPPASTQPSLQSRLVF